MEMKGMNVQSKKNGMQKKKKKEKKKERKKERANKSRNKVSRQPK